MKKYILILLFISLFMSGCGQSKQYGVDVLKLDNFDFDLNIDKFFADEGLFRGTNKDFRVDSREEFIDGDSIKIGYIQYYTMMRSEEHPLASYAGVNFESLGIVADEADEKVLMAIATNDNANDSEIEKIINKLMSEYGMKNPIFENSYRGINLKFKNGNKVANFYMDITIKHEEMDEEREEKEESKLTSLRFENIKIGIKNKEDIACTLFLTTEFFDRALGEARGFSGDLTRYRN